MLRSARVWGLGLACGLCLLLAGCIEMEEGLTINADGSATVTIQYVMGKEMVDMIQGMQQMQGGQEGKGDNWDEGNWEEDDWDEGWKEAEQEEAKKEEEPTQKVDPAQAFAEQMAKEFETKTGENKNVRLTAVRGETVGEKVHVTMTLECTDLAEFEKMQEGGAGQRAMRIVDAGSGKLKYLSTFSTEGTPFANLPETPPAPEGETGKGQEQEQGEQDDDAAHEDGTGDGENPFGGQDMEQFQRQMLEGFRLKFSVTVPTAIAETNAHETEGNTVSWTYSAQSHMDELRSGHLEMFVTFSGEGVNIHPAAEEAAPKAPETGGDHEDHEHH